MAPPGNKELVAIEKAKMRTKAASSSKVIVQDYTFGGDMEGKARCSKHTWVDSQKDGVRVRKFNQTDYQNRDDFKYFDVKYLAENSARVRQCDECKVPFFRSRPAAGGLTRIVRKNKATGEFEEVEKVTKMDEVGKPVKTEWKDLDDDCDYYRTCLKKHPYVRRWNKVLKRMDLINLKIPGVQEWMKGLDNTNLNHPKEGTVLMVPHIVNVCECSAAEDSTCSVGYCNPCFIAKCNTTLPDTPETEQGAARRNRPSRTRKA